MKRILLSILILAMIFTTACWDMIEINDRVFPYTVGMDLNNGEEKDFTVSFSYPNINAIGKNGSSDEKVFVVSSKANNIYEATHELTNRMGQPLYLKHLKVLLISENIAKEPEIMKGIIDGLNRDFVINKMVDMVVVRGSAKELIESKLKATRQESIEGVFYDLLRNKQTSTQFTTKSLTDFIEDMDVSSSAMVPLAAASEDEILIAGGAIFKDYGLVGYIDGMENRGVAILTGQVTHDGIDIKYNGDMLSLLTTNVQSKKQLINKEELKVKFKIDIEGQIHQYTMEDGLSSEESEKLLHDMERAIEKSIKADLESTMNKLQKDLRTDVTGIAAYLSKFHPKLWKSIEDDWDNIYPEMDIEIDVTMHIRRRGLVR